MRKEDDLFVGLQSGKDLTFRGKPVLDISGEVPLTLEIYYVLLRHRGGLPLAFGASSGHGWSRWWWW